MPKKLYKDVPDGYPVCLHGDCPLAEDCLHRLAYHILMERSDILRVVNPNHCVKDQSCPYFRSATPVMCARGFTAMQQNMLPRQYRVFMEILVERFGRNSYYERRRGDILLSPQEQDVVRCALREAGVQEALDFDRYEENVWWYE